MVRPVAPLRPRRQTDALHLDAHDGENHLPPTRN
jgi:hypothetical protein